MDFQWFKQEIADGLTYHRLYVGGVETPWFISEGRQIQHRTSGHKYGLFGTGLGKEIQTAGGSYRIAGELGGFNCIGEAKKRAESFYAPASAPFAA